MTNRITLTLLIGLFCIFQSIAQITTTIVDVLVNNQTTIDNCGLIDFGSTTSNNLTVNFKLTKPASQAVGTVTVTVYLKYSSAQNPGTNKGTYSVPNTAWTNGGVQFEGQIPINISSNEIQVTGSSIYAKVDSESCEYPLNKTPAPEFQLLPATVNLSCGATGTTNFSVWNVHSSPGTPTYSWNVGNGWSLPDGTPVSGTLATTSSNVQLKPSSGTILPSSVTVTVTLNSNQYYDAATVNRSNIAQTITAISGPSTLCSGTTAYNFGQESVVSGQTVDWSISDTSIATLSNATNTGVSLTQVGSGEVTLTATISNGCGQSYSRTKAMFAGGPSFF